MRYFIIFSLLLLTGCCETRCSSLPNTEITNMYSSYVDEWKQQAQNAFKDAESKVFVVIPKPEPVIDPMNPDPAKCICKGTGIIVQGDGHKTACKYHAKSLNSR